MNKKQLIDKLRAQDFPTRIVDAFGKVRRELFVPIEFKSEVYQDNALPIGHGQTISQPYTIAFMLSLLNVEDGQNILEIGSGSGYVLALLAELNKKGKIIGVERIAELAKGSREKLKDYENIEIIHGDALKDVGEKFDRILASAAFEELPQQIINKNLKMGGVMVVPVKNSIFYIKKDSGENKVRQYPGFVFVPVVKGKG